jgi:hypothetical protein
LRQASRVILSELPDDVNNLRVFGRPALVYYLAMTGRIAVSRQPDLAHLAENGGPKTWAVLDLAMTRQNNVSELDLQPSIPGWALAREISTSLNLPTLLDLDPAAARGAAVDVTAPLWLLRPKRMEYAR